MKKILKALGVAAVAAAVVPCKIEKDEITGVKTYQSLLSRLRIGPGKDGDGTDIRFSLLDGLLPTALRGEREEEDYADDELEDMSTESIFEMKVERSIPNEPKFVDSETSESPESSDTSETAEVSEPEEPASESELDL